MAPPDPLDANVRVLTLNIWRRNRDWPARRRIIAGGLGDAMPDLIALQEVMVDDAGDQALEILPPGYHVLQQRGRRADGSGITIASRWPIVRTDEVDLHVTPRTADFECGAILAEIEAPDPFGAIVLVNHFPSWQPSYASERERQAVLTAKAIEQFAGADRSSPHVILAGDLDADPTAASIRFWTGRQSLEGMSVCYRDAWESANPGREGADAVTFTNLNPLMLAADWPFGRIDYVLVRCGFHDGPTLAIRRCQRIFDGPETGGYGSDHIGVIADLAVPRPSR